MPRPHEIRVNLIEFKLALEVYVEIGGIKSNSWKFDTVAMSILLERL